MYTVIFTGELDFPVSIYGRVLKEVTHNLESTLALLVHAKLLTVVTCHENYIYHFTDYIGRNGTAEIVYVEND